MSSYHLYVSAAEIYTFEAASDGSASAFADNYMLKNKHTSGFLRHYNKQTQEWYTVKEW